MSPNRIKIHFDGGSVEIYGDMFSDMLTSWALALFERQKQAQAELAKISLRDDGRKDQFATACFNYDDAESRLRIADAIEKVFHNRAVEPKHYVQPILEGP